MPEAMLEDEIMSVTDARHSFSKVLNLVREGHRVTIHHGSQVPVTLVRRDWLAEILKVRDELLNHIESVEDLVHEIDVLEMSADPGFVQVLRSRLESLKTTQGIPLSQVKAILEG
jgi:hypothetical protein